MSNRSLEVCPHCGERLQQDWLRPLLVALALIVAVVLILAVGPWLLRELGSLRPSVALSAMRAAASKMPVLVEVPSLTPSLTPSVTPTPTSTPTSTPIPTLTPLPSLTPTPTPTRTPLPTSTSSPTPTRTRRPATPTSPPANTPTPLPTVQPPIPLAPENQVSFGEKASFRLTWQSSHTPKPDECYLVTVRYVHYGSEVRLPVCVQQAFWWVDRGLYLEADQETGRAYYWRVAVVRKQIDASGKETFVPLSLPSEERSFYWR